MIASDDGMAAGEFARLTELSDVFLACRLALNEVSHGTLWAPGPGSAAAWVSSELRQLPSDGSSTRHFTMVSDVIQTYLVTAGEHLGALAALYRVGEVAVSAAAIARSVIECSARALLVIGEHVNGKVVPQDLLVRAFLEEAVSADQACRAARMGDKTDPAAAAAKSRLKSVRAAAAPLFDDSTMSANFAATPPMMNGQKCFSPTEAVEWMFGFLARGASLNMSTRQALGIYDFLSSHSHPTLYPLRDARQWTQHAGHIHGNIVIELGHLERLATVTIISFYNALGYAISFYGVDSTAHKLLSQRIEATMPSFFTGGSR